MCPDAANGGEVTAATGGGEACDEVSQAGVKVTMVMGWMWLGEDTEPKGVTGLIVGHVGCGRLGHSRRWNGHRFNYFLGSPM